MRARTLTVLFAMVAAAAVGAEKTESIVKTFPMAPGKVVLVDAGPLDLSVRSAEIQEIRLTVDLAAGALKEAQAAAWVERHRPTIADSDSKLTIQAPDPPGVDLLKGVIVTRAKIELVLPVGACPDLSVSSGSMRVEGAFPQCRPLRVRSANGDVEFSGWAPDAEFRSTSGDLSVQASRAFESVLLRTANGRVDLTGGAHRLRGDSSSGTMHLAGLLGEATIATTSGNVDAMFDALPPGVEVHISTSSGKVRVVLPGEAKPGGELISSRGEIRSSFPGEVPDPAQPHLVLAGSGGKLYVTTTSGRIELQ